MIPGGAAGLLPRGSLASRGRHSGNRPAAGEWVPGWVGGGGASLSMANTEFLHLPRARPAKVCNQKNPSCRVANNSHVPFPCRPCGWCTCQCDACTRGATHVGEWEKGGRGVQKLCECFSGRGRGVWPELKRAPDQLLERPSAHSRAGGGVAGERGGIAETRALWPQHFVCASFQAFERHVGASTHASKKNTCARAENPCDGLQLSPGWIPA